MMSAKPSTSSVFRLPSSVFRLPSSVFRLPSSVFCLLSSAFCLLSSVSKSSVSQQTVRYYGTYSNKTRGQTPLIPDRIVRPPQSSPDLKSPISNLQSEILLVPAPPKQSARSMRPLWRDMILKVWGADPLQCPCCKAPMKLAGAVKRPEQVEFFLRLHGLWACHS